MSNRWRAVLYVCGCRNWAGYFGRDLDGSERLQTFGLVLLDMDVLGSDEGTLNEFCGAASVIQFSVIEAGLTMVHLRGGSIVRRLAWSVWLRRLI